MHSQLYLKQYRNRSGLTLKQLASHLDVHWTSLQKWESGTVSLPMPFLFRIAAFYKIEPGHLFEDPERLALQRANKDRYTKIAEVMPVEWVERWLDVAEQTADLIQGLG